MKNILIIIILFSSCHGVADSEQIVSVHKSDYDNMYSRYSTNNGSFYAPIGLYNIGDKVKFTNENSRNSTKNPFIQVQLPEDWTGISIDSTKCDTLLAYRNNDKIILTFK